MPTALLLFFFVHSNICMNATDAEIEDASHVEAASCSPDRMLQDAYLDSSAMHCTQTQWHPTIAVQNLSVWHHGLTAGGISGRQSEGRGMFAALADAAAQKAERISRVAMRKSRVVPLPEKPLLAYAADATVQSPPLVSLSAVMRHECMQWYQVVRGRLKGQLGTHALLSAGSAWRGLRSCSFGQCP